MIAPKAKEATQQTQPYTPAREAESASEEPIAATTAQVEYFPVLPTGVYHNPYPPQIPVSRLPTSAVPLWTNTVPVELDVYVSENEYFVDYDANPSWHQDDIMLGDAMGSREHHIEIPTTPVKYSFFFLLIGVQRRKEEEESVCVRETDRAYF